MSRADNNGPIAMLRDHFGDKIDAMDADYRRSKGLPPVESRGARACRDAAERAAIRAELDKAGIP